MTLQINMNPGSSANGGVGVGVMTSAGNPWTVADALAQTLVNQGRASPLNWPAEVPGLTSAEILAFRTSVSGAWNARLDFLGAEYRRGLVSGNPRTLAQLTTSAVAFGGTPTAGQLGYANSSIVTTGYLTYDITAGATGGSVAPFRISGAQAYRGGTPVQGSSYYSSGGTRHGAIWKMGIWTNAPEPVFSLIGYSGSYYVQVDGQRAASVLAASASGGYQDLSVNLRGLTAGWHLVEFLFQQDETIAGIKLAKQYQLLTPQPRPPLLMIGDSLTGSAPDGRSVDCFAQVMADWLGADLWNLGFGGSGYEVPGSGGETFRSRIPLIAATYTDSPAVVVYAGGRNDTNSGTLQAEVAATVTAGKAQWPLARHVVFGPWSQNNPAAQAQDILKEAKIKAAAAAAGALFVPVMTDPTGVWITGTGAIDGLTGDGTADTLFKVADATHWAIAGHAIIGRKAAFAAAGVLGL